MTPALTSIVILTLNQLEYTKQCVDSIARHTPEPHELIFVDNGSTDGTLEYLRALPSAAIGGIQLGRGARSTPHSSTRPDRPVLRAAHAVVVAGRSARARIRLARLLGVAVIEAEPDQ